MKQKTKKIRGKPFPKGNTPWNKGRKMSREHCEINRQGQLGKKMSEEARRKISLALKGKNNPMWGKTHSDDTKEKMRKKKLGRKLSLKTKLKMSKKRKGANHPNWQGGISGWQKSIRNSMEYNLWRGTVLKRDNYTCQCCSVCGGDLHVHHILPFKKYPELVFSVENGETLCVPCHRNTFKSVTNV